MARISIDREKIAAFRQRWQVAELALFGSALREDFQSDSDVDVLVRFLPEARHGLFNLARMQKELEGLLGRQVDLVERSAIEKSRNYIRRKAILSSLETLYATR